MKGSKYLSDILTSARIQKFQKGSINAITAWVGSGKTDFSMNVLHSTLPPDKHMLFLTDTCMNREQVLATFSNVQAYDKDWRKHMNRLSKITWGRYPFILKDNITVMNYAQVGAILYYGHEFDWGAFEYVVCDEIHNLVNYAKIKSKAKDIIPVNVHDITIDKINDTLATLPDVKIIGLSATPSNLWQRFSNVNYVLSDAEMADLYQFEVFNEKPYRDYVKVLRNIQQGEKGIIYFDRITALEAVEELLNVRNHVTASFWSLNNEDHPMTQAQKDVRRHIVEHQLIPPNIDILLINAACQTGVNIKNTDIDFMMVHSQNEDILTQVRGRLRHDLNLLHCLKMDNSIDVPCPVPAKYLNRVLMPSDTKAVYEEVRLMKPAPKNEIYRWGKVKDYLIANGHKIYQKTQGHGGKVKGWVIEKI